MSWFFRKKNNSDENEKRFSDSTEENDNTADNEEGYFRRDCVHDYDLDLHAFCPRCGRSKVYVQLDDHGDEAKNVECPRCEHVYAVSQNWCPNCGRPSW